MAKDFVVLNFCLFVLASIIDVEGSTTKCLIILNIILYILTMKKFKGIITLLKNFKALNLYCLMSIAFIDFICFIS